MHMDHHLISRMPEGVKIRLLTDFGSLAGGAVPTVDAAVSDGLDVASATAAETTAEAAGKDAPAAVGTPRVTCAPLWDEGLLGFPAPAVMARSWDTALLRDVSADLCRERAGKGVHLVFLPGAKTGVPTAPVKGEAEGGFRLSEDPCLAGELAASLVEGSEGTGVMTALSGYGYTPAERAGLDNPLPVRFEQEFLVRPVRAALENGGCGGILCEADGTVPPSLLTVGRDTGPERVILRRQVEEKDTVAAIRAGHICLSASPAALQRALHRYRRIAAAIEHGKATVCELEAAVNAGEALSEAELDEAVYRLLTFAARCEEAASSSGNGTKPPVSGLAERAVWASSVLLENRGHVLPLTKPARVCLIGDMLGADAVKPHIDRLTAAGHTCVGFARGYDSRTGGATMGAAHGVASAAASRRDHLVSEAVEVAAKADIVLLFLGTACLGGGRSGGDHRRLPRLPADQLALCDRLTRMDKTVIAVVSSETAVDLGFATHAVRPMAGLLLAPLDAPDGVRVALELLLGTKSPIGRLTDTIIDRVTAYPNGTDPRHGLRIGPFVGYRYYDAVNCGVAYPFGHGLTYTSFRYTAPKLSNGRITFSVTNTGKRAGVAIPQVYAGMRETAVLRPRKELIGFARVELAPHETKQVVLPFRDIPTFYSDTDDLYYTGDRGVRHAEAGRFLSEKGTYLLYVGESVSDIRAHAEVQAGTVTLPPDRADLSDYLPSVSNIPTKHYTLEAEHTPMKHLLRNPLCGIVALVLAASLKIYDIITNTDAVFLDMVAGILAVFAVLFFIAEMRDRKKQFGTEREAMEAATRALYADADTIPIPSADALFGDEMTVPADEAEGDLPDTEGLTDRDFYADVDKELTFPVAARALVGLGHEKGVAIDEATAGSIFAAMASSRLVLVRGMADEAFDALLRLLGDYFECTVTADRVDESYGNEAALLFATGETGETVKRNLLLTMESARSNPHGVAVAALTGVTLEGLSRYMTPFARYARTPRSGCTVILPDGAQGEVAYAIPENLWLILQVEEGEPLDALPDYVAEIASVNRWQVELTSPAEGNGEYGSFRYGQMLYLCEKAAAAFVSNREMDEDVWKKLDRLEAYAARFGDFRMTNKIWLGLETYLAVLAAIGTDAATALDEALAVKVMPAVIRALSGKLPREERGLADTLDALFGDDRTARCRRVIKESGADLT